MRPLTGTSLVLATHNEKKIHEFSGLLGLHGIQAIPASELGLSAPEETEETLEGNALLKAGHAFRCTGLPSLGDDSGLEVEALGNRPGVHSADWAEAPTGRNHARAMARVHRELLETGLPLPHRARFRAVIGVIWPDGSSETFEGAVHG